jgi:hypothetical protein
MDALEEIATLRAALAEREAELVTACGFRRNPARDSDLMSATVPI